MLLLTLLLTAAVICKTTRGRTSGLPEAQLFVLAGPICLFPWDQVGSSLIFFVKHVLFISCFFAWFWSLEFVDGWHPCRPKWLSKFDFISLSSSFSLFELCLVLLFAFIKWNFHFSWLCFCHLGAVWQHSGRSGCSFCGFILKMPWLFNPRFQTYLVFPLFLIIILVSQACLFLEHIFHACQTLFKWLRFPPGDLVICLTPALFRSLSGVNFSNNPSLCRGTLFLYPVFLGGKL